MRNCVKVTNLWQSNFAFFLSNLYLNLNVNVNNMPITSKYICIYNILPTPLPTVAIKEVCTRWFYDQGTVLSVFNLLFQYKCVIALKLQIFGRLRFLSIQSIPQSQCQCQ